MLIDFLRYVAYAGRLRAFFDNVVYEYADKDSITGQHLRFDMAELPRFGLAPWRYRDYEEEEWRWHIAQQLGIERVSDTLSAAQSKNGDWPPTFEYREPSKPCKLEIIIDINPDLWRESYIEPRNFEGTRIIYRRVGPALATVGSGDRLRNQHDRIGTLCGFFICPKTGLCLALTCGHVAMDRSRVLIEQPRRFWKLKLGSSLTSLGDTLFYSLPEMLSQGECASLSQMDAALVHTSLTSTAPSPPVTNKTATIKSISSMMQEHPVWFKGAARNGPTLARIAAVTVRKSIDLLRDGKLRDVGDVLMLGHREKMYVVQKVSLDGDSGAAVRGESSETPYGIDYWYGMVLGSDDSAAYVSYAEFLTTWAAQQLNDPQTSFAYEI